MRIAVTLAALALAFVPAIAAAQNVPMVQAPPALQDDMAPFVRATAQTMFESRDTRIEFIVREGIPMVRFTPGWGHTVDVWLLRDHASVLRVLADQRFSGLWPAVVEWGGPDMRKASDALVRLTQLAYSTQLDLGPRTTAENTGGLRARTVLQYADALHAAGRRDEGVALLRKTLAEADAARWDIAESNVVRLRLAGTLHGDGQSEAAITELRIGEANPSEGAYALNYEVNRAAFLAEDGRYAEALATIGDVTDHYFGHQSRKYRHHGERVPGSGREFDWIRACALKGLGRDDEAQALIAGLRAAPEPPDEGFFPPTNFQVNVRADLCFGDVEGLVHDFLRALRPNAIAPVALLWLQPERVLDPRRDALLARVRADPRIAAALAGLMRPFPAALVPALNQWRDSPPPAAP